MVDQPAKDMLVKIGDGASPESFTTVAGLTTKSLALNRETVDVTDQDSTGRWRELLAGAGVRSATISGDGIFADGDSDEDLRAAFFAGSIENFQFDIPDFGIIEGPFEITALEFSGAHNEAVQFSITFESAGELTFSADS